MAGFNLSGLFGGPINGIKAGLKYDAQFLSSFAWAVKSGKTAALNALVVIAEQNVNEAMGQTGDILPSVIGALVSGGDPFSGSRHAFQAWQQQYGVH
jgi:hypothetical protein